MNFVDFVIVSQTAEMDEVAFRGDGDDQGNKDIAVEAEPTHLPLGVSIKDLVKVSTKIRMTTDFNFNEYVDAV